MANLPAALAISMIAAFGLAVLSAVAGFGGGALLLPVFTGLFGLRVAVPVLTLTQIASNGGRVWFNRRNLEWRAVARFSGGAIPFAIVGGLLLAHAPLAPLKRILGIFLIVVVVWRHLRPQPKPPSDNAFIAVGAASGLGSALLGSVGPLTAPFFLAKGYTRAVFIGTEAACALITHAAKIGTYGASNLLTVRVLLLGVAMTPATLAGAWAGKKVLNRLSDRVFVVLVESGLVIAGLLFLAGIA
jgi:uncharacterized membrane protein YfcA